ncbi:amidase [Salinimonas sp. HHU 13199]|uniref:Amidase n=1 Tax=Salinimonas profundi TaxID=2729140 RepID=A0ABR8LNX3_9ALTE|nr:amidase [Salinimonas profundi]MBD3586761.1 amidase [Salinimonas profundi]
MKAKIKTRALTVAALTVAILSGCASSNRSAESVSADPVAADYQPDGVVAMTLPEISKALADGIITSQELVAQYLARIEAIDSRGPGLNAVLTLNPDALEIARALDAQREAGQILGPLHGVPVLLKDNIESKDAMPTTAGALALQNNMTGRDSPLVAGLRAQGAIILGKTNLSQWANFRSEHSMSGWSALGGQVKNPHMLDRNPCGSSSGSGAAMAASLAAATVGTETNGSITCPSTVNGIVGFKPSVGIIPQEFIVPISHSQDTAGPMTKTVTGAAMMMNAMATEAPGTDFTHRLQDDALEGVRVGVLRFATGSDARIQALFERALKDLEAAGAVLVEINAEPETPDNFGKMAYDLLKYEFKSGINDYLASTAAEQVEPRSLEDLIAYNQTHSDEELALFDQSIFVASQEMDSLDSDDYRDSARQVQQVSRRNIDTLLANQNVDVLVAPTGVIAPRVDPINGDVWPGGWPGYGSAAARAGYPHATVPMGGVQALPVGLSFIGSNLQDANVLSYAYAYEQVSQRRLTPQYYENAEALDAIGQAMNPAR